MERIIQHDLPIQLIATVTMAVGFGIVEFIEASAILAAWHHGKQEDVELHPTRSAIRQDRSPVTHRDIAHPAPVVTSADDMHMLWQM